MKNNVKKLTYSAVALSAAILMPFLTANDMALGNALCLMHIPIILCGFICGPVWGGAVGFIAPLLKGFVITPGRPPVLTAVPMAFELCTYAVVAGLMYKLLPKKIQYTYVTLISAMLSGRIVWGAAKAIVLGFKGKVFAISAFWAEGFVNALPGIGLQIVLIPLIIIALEKSGLILNKKKTKQ